jgi:hypothetical protein
MLVYQGWIRWRATVVDPDGLAPVVSLLCDRFNSCYSAWLTLVAARSDGGAVVRYEDLTGDLDPLVERLARGLRLAGRCARARVSPTCSPGVLGRRPESRGERLSSNTSAGVGGSSRRCQTGSSRL